MVIGHYEKKTQDGRNIFKLLFNKVITKSYLRLYVDKYNIVLCACGSVRVVSRIFGVDRVEPLRNRKKVLR